jgi:hypothetical protein
MCGNKEQRSVYLRVSKGASVALAGAPFYGHPTALLTALLLHYWGLAGAPFTGTLLRYYCFTTALLGARRGPFYGHPRAASAALLLLYYCFTTALLLH